MRWRSNENIFGGNLSCSGNFLAPSNDYLCKNNEPLYNRINEGFSDFCYEKTPTLAKDNDTWTIENHCQFINKDEEYKHVNVTRSDFSGFKHDDNGRAIHIINAGMTLDTGTFKECNSKNGGGGGGGIYIYNQQDISNRVSIKNSNFYLCRAAFGGAIFVFTLSENVNAHIDESYI